MEAVGVEEALRKVENRLSGIKFECWWSRKIDKPHGTIEDELADILENQIIALVKDLQNEIYDYEIDEDAELPESDFRVIVETTDSKVVESKWCPVILKIRGKRFQVWLSAEHGYTFTERPEKKEGFFELKQVKIVAEKAEEKGREG